MATGRAVDFGPILRGSQHDFSGRRWLFDQIDEFIQQVSGPQTLFVIGDAGAGKTTVLARLAEKRPRAAHFFCGRSDAIGADQGGGWSEPTRCAETMGTQLLEVYGHDLMDWTRIGIEADMSVRSTRANIEAEIDCVEGSLIGVELARFVGLPRAKNDPVVRARGKFGIAPGANVALVQIHKLLVDPILALQEFLIGPLRRAALRNAEPIVLIVDAIDEWDRQACSVDIVELVKRCDLPENVKIVASARPSYASKIPLGSVIIDLSSPHTKRYFDEDIRELVDNVVAKKGLHPPTRFRDDFISRAEGNFLFARYVLDAMEDGQFDDTLKQLPIGLEAFHRQELAKLFDQIEREGLRGDLVPLLSVVCSAREPIGLENLANAAEMATDIAADVMRRLRSFVRPVPQAGEEHYAPYHASFGEFVLSGTAGFGIKPESGHFRLARALVPTSNQSWSMMSDYAIRQVMAHAAASGVATFVQSLITDAAYLVARVDNLGPEALHEDLRHANSASIKPAFLAEMAAELGLRVASHQAGKVVTAQGLALAAGTVGAKGLAESFAKLVTQRPAVVPVWSAGLEGAAINAGGFHTREHVEAAALTSGRLLTLVRDEHIDVWRIEDHMKMTAIGPIAGVRLALAEPDGMHVWAAVKKGNDSWEVQRLAMPSGNREVEYSLQQRVEVLAIDPTGRWLAVGTGSGRVLILDPTDGAQIARKDIGGVVQNLRFNSGHLAALTRNRKVVVWHVPSCRLEAVEVVSTRDAKNELSSRSDGLAFDWERAEVVVGGVDGKLTQVDLGGGGVQQELCALDGWADHVGFLGKSHIVAGDSSGRLHFINRSNSSRTTFRAHVSEIRLIECLDDQRTLTVSSDGEVGLWRVPQRELIGESAHSAEVLDIAFDSNGQSVMSLGADFSVMQWSPGGSLIQCGFLAPDLCESARLTPDLGGRVIEKNGLHRQQFADMAADTLAAERWPRPIFNKCETLFSAPIRSFAITDDASIAVRSELRRVELWTLEPAVPRLAYEGEWHAGRGSLSGDGAFLVTDIDGRLRLRCLEAVSETRDLPFGKLLLCAPFWSRDGRFIAVAQEDEVQLLNLETLACCSRWWMSGAKPEFAVTSPTGDEILVFGVGGLTEIRSIEGDLLNTFVFRPVPSICVFSSDGQRLAVGDKAGGVHVFGLWR